MNIQISNLHSDTTEVQLSELFGTFGAVRSGRVRTIANVSKSHMSTFAYIHMDSRAEGEAATAGLNNSTFMGNVIAVKEAR